MLAMSPVGGHTAVLTVYAVIMGSGRVRLRREPLEPD
jgi:hypothetical protein